MASAITPPEMRGVNVVLLRDGTEIHLDDILTAAHGQDVLDDLDAAIDAIENQISRSRDQSGQDVLEWRRRAEVALKRKRRLRPRLQQRIGDLRRAERRVDIEAQVQRQIEKARPDREERRVAFIDAAEAMLDRDLFLEIWERAKALRPAAFAEARS